MARRRGRLLPTPAQALLDAGLINLGFAGAWWARYQAELGREVTLENYLPWSSYLGLELLLTALLLVVFRLNGLYHLRRGAGWIDEVGLIFSGTTIGSAAMIVAVFYFRPFGYSRLVFVYAWALIIALLAAERLGERFILAHLRRRGIGLQRILVVGAGRQGRLIMQNVVAQPELGYQIVGFVDERRREDIGRFRALGTPDDLPRLLWEFDIDEVIIALPSASHQRIVDIMLLCQRQGVSFRLVPDVFELSLNQLDIEDLNGIPLIGTREVSIRGINLFLKRAMDVAIATLALIVLAPLMGLIALAIKLDSPGPVLLRQVRIGRHGKPFVCYKFRSMRVGAEQELERLQAFNEARGPIFKMRNDPRRTRVGRILRRLSLDELPQLLNVLKNEMSLVGPRPPLPHEVERYEPWHRRRLEVAPGMTGLWQVSGRSNLTFDEMVLLDIWYIENWSLWLDVKILLRTIPAVLLGVGAY